MNLVKRHPEAHDAWLYAMGIDVRWRHRTGLTEVGTALDASVVELPECIAKARYWVIGEQPLTDAQAYVLAGILWAIGAQSNADCVYSHLQNGGVQSVPHAVATGLSVLPTINTLAVEPILLKAPIDDIQNTALIALGDVAMVEQTDEQIIRVPSLQAMINTPLLKKSAWSVLKVLRTELASI